jgi:hypothetical protein
LQRLHDEATRILAPHTGEAKACDSAEREGQQSVAGAEVSTGAQTKRKKVLQSLLDHWPGLITLPPPRHKPSDTTVTITAQTDPGPPIRKPARALTPLRLQPVQNRPDSRLWNEYVQRYHYLGHNPLPAHKCATSSSQTRS